MKGRALFGGLKEENCMFWRACLYILGNFSWARFPGFLFPFM